MLPSELGVGSCFSSCYHQIIACEALINQIKPTEEKAAMSQTADSTPRKPPASQEDTTMPSTTPSKPQD